MIQAIIGLIAKIFGPLLALLGAYLKGKEAAKVESNIIVLETKVKNDAKAKAASDAARNATDDELIDSVYGPPDDDKR
jgi:hypothetical protein